MRPFRLLLASLALAALAALAPAQLLLAAHGDRDSLPFDHPETYDGLMIATALGPPVGRAFPDDANMVVQRFRVLDSRAFAPGSVVDVYFRALGGGRAMMWPQDGQPFEPPNAVPTGGRALLFASAARNGVLSVPVLPVCDPRETQRRALGPDAPSSAFAAAWFPTTQARLAQDPDPKWRLYGSLAASIPGTSDANARAIKEALRLMPVPMERAYGGPDDRFSRTFADAVAHDKPYHRALVDQALNALQYWGYGDQFSRDLRASADDPDAFPDGVPNRLPFYEDPDNNPTLPKGFRHGPPLSQAEILAVLARAKSPTIAAGFLEGLPKPSDADVYALARFLDSPDPRLRWAFAERLATWYGYAPPAKPVETYDPVAKERHYASNPELDATVAMWKGKLAAGTLP